MDPRDPQTVYLTNTSTYRSTDGGRTLAAIKGAPGGDDYHTVWINPSDPRILALASDQGATISVDGGATWSSWYNQPTAQMYHVNADDRFPYWLCGGQQESGSACVSSRGAWGQTTVRDWHPAGAQEYGYVVPDPLHPGVFYGGKVERFDERTGQAQEVSPIALPTKQFRVVRTEPIAFDRFDRHRMYFGSNVVFATEDGGQTWHVVSPDLTRAQPGVPAVLGAFASDDPAHGKHRGVVYALAPSYVHRGTLWAGTDDGQVWIARDVSGTGLAHWKNVTPPELTPWSKIAQIDASRTDDETAFVAVTRFRLDDQRPYVYITHDGGAHWRLAVEGLPNEPVNAVRQDPVQPRLLYAATENGVYVSFDEGAHWQSLQLGLPHTSVRDLIVHGDDLAIATHGRGFWILDDVEPLRELAAGPSTSVRMNTSIHAGDRVPRALEYEHRYAAAAGGAGRTESARRCDHRLLRSPRRHSASSSRSSMPANARSARSPATIRSRSRSRISISLRTGSARSRGRRRRPACTASSGICGTRRRTRWRKISRSRRSSATRRACRKGHCCLRGATWCVSRWTARCSSSRSSSLWIRG